MPNIGLGLLKAGVERIGFEVDIEYLNLKFAHLCNQLNLDNFYDLIANGYHDYNELHYGSYIGEWLFSQYLYNTSCWSKFAYYSHIRNHSQGIDVTEKEIRKIALLSKYIEYFIISQFKRIEWQKYFLVGFHSSFQQNMPVFCFARLIKQNYPEIKIAIGGANCIGEMGLEIARQFSYFDFVFTGEADVSFPELVSHLYLNNPVEEIKGVVKIEGDKIVYNGPAELVQDLNMLPYPDYSDYFRQRRECCELTNESIIINLEASRGCWWGEKKQCAFCGLNGAAMKYRLKAPKRVFDEVKYFQSLFPNNNVIFQFVDNVMPNEFFNSFLPMISKNKRNDTFFFEIRPTINKEQVLALSDAGVTQIQVGIENLSTKVLKLIHKGTSALKCVSILKECKRRNINVNWNIIVGFPYEDLIQYKEIFKRMQRISHLDAPHGIGYVRLDRFSDFHRDPVKHGFHNIRSRSSLKFIYPFDDSVIMNLSYSFDFDTKNRVNLSILLKPLYMFLTNWKNQNGDTLFLKKNKDGGATLIDTRFNKVLDTYPLNKFELIIYEYCNIIRHIDQIYNYIKNDNRNVFSNKQELSIFLDNLVNLKFIDKDGNNYLSLAL